MPAKTYAQHCLCLVSAKPEQREALEKIFAKVSPACCCFLRLSV